MCEYHTLLGLSYMVYDSKHYWKWRSQVRMVWVTYRNFVIISVVQSANIYFFYRVPLSFLIRFKGTVFFLIFTLPISIPPVWTGGWKQPPQADGQRPNTAMPPVLTVGYLLKRNILPKPWYTTAAAWITADPKSICGLCVRLWWKCFTRPSL